MKIFQVPICDKFLLYAPLHKLTAVINREALCKIGDYFQNDSVPTTTLSKIVERLQSQISPVPVPRTGTVTAPLFLGLIPTRGCNMACHYCDFAAPKQNGATMSLDTTRRAINAYFDLIEGQRHADVHFFGGEPFFADEIVHFAVEYASLLAAERGLDIRFEATTNGVYNDVRCRWIAEHFDTIVLSLDGPPDIQDRHRPGVNGHPTSNIVIRNARILSEGSVELIIRACITNETVSRMAEIARWICQEFRPSTVCFETLSLSHTAEPIPFTVPEPRAFARNYDRAARILADYGIEAAMSTADLRSPRISFCPIGKDALIVSPDGAVDGCYLLQKDWEQRDLDLRLGWLRSERFELLPEAVQRIRNLSVETKSLCANCLCRYSCAGGCHVNHDTSGASGQYDDMCIHTRIITITRLLRGIGQDALADAWLNDSAALEKTVWQTDDRLIIQKMPV